MTVIENNLTYSLCQEESDGQYYLSWTYYKRTVIDKVYGGQFFLKDVRAKNFYNTDFFHTLATVR